MAQITGTIQKVMVKKDNIKISKNGQEYCGLGVCIDDKWYNTNFMWAHKTKGLTFCTFDGTELVAGDTVTLTLDDAYNSIQTNKTVLVSKGAGAPAKAPFKQSGGYQKKSFTPKKEAADVDWDLRNLQIRVGGLLHDSTALVSALIQSGSIPKTILDKSGKDPEKKGFDDSTMMSLVEHYMYQLYMLGDKAVANLQDPEFIKNLQLPEEEK